MRPGFRLFMTCAPGGSLVISILYRGAGLGYLVGQLYCVPFRQEVWMKLFFAALLALSPAVAAAQDWYEPQRGSAERRDLMDAIRPKAEEIFGAPVEFVIGQLRVSGDRAFASVQAQRPGGGAIDVVQTPGWQIGYFLADADWTGGQALLVRSNAGWVPSDVVFGATDVWWSEPRLCAEFRAVIADVCP